MDWDYPELYYRIYPKVIRSINNHLDNNFSNEMINEEKFDLIVDDVYRNLTDECPEINSDPNERRGRARAKSTQSIFYGRRQIVRDLISILLISELLRRNSYGGNYPYPY